VEKIRQWRIIEGDYSKAPDVDAHWFIDPPYQQAGYTYRCNHIDYPGLAKWCKQRRGYLQVCENTEANWLPFAPFSIVDSHRAHRLRRCSAEAIFEFENLCAPAMSNLSWLNPTPMQSLCTLRNHCRQWPRNVGRASTSPIR
jgi:hypothetical protein